MTWVAVAFWWFAILDVHGSPQFIIARFLYEADCEAARGFYERVIEESGREDRRVGPCNEHREAAR